MMRPPTSTAGANLDAFTAAMPTGDQQQYAAAVAAKTPKQTAVRTPVPWTVHHGGHARRVVRDADEVSQEALRMPAAKQAKLVEHMQAVGLLDDGAVTRSEFEDAWDHLVGLAVRWHSANPKSMLDPTDMLDLYYGKGDHTEVETDKGFIGAGAKAKNATARKVVQRQVDLATNEDARDLLGNMLTRELGRRPSVKEVDDFQAALNDAQSKNPYVTTQMTGGSGLGGGSGSADSTTMDGNGKRLASSRTTKSGGVDPQQYADQYFQSKYNDSGLDSEYGSYQAATTYMSALMQALKGTV